METTSTAREMLRRVAVQAWSFMSAATGAPAPFECAWLQARVPMHTLRSKHRVMRAARLTQMH
eukprot:6187779-Pleurochrysis_carterae.AAC.4